MLRSALIAGIMVPCFGGIVAAQEMVEVPSAQGARLVSNPASSMKLFDHESSSSFSYEPMIEEERSAAFADDDSELWFKLNAVFWLPIEVTGPVGLADITTDFDLRLNEILHNLDWAVEGGFELGQDDWSLLFWGYAARLEADATTRHPITGNVDSHATIKSWHVDFAGAYKLGEWAIGDSETATWRFDALAGVRYWEIDFTIDVEDARVSADVGPDAGWVDPVIGGRLSFDFTKEINASLRADIGGFDIGTASDFTWSIMGVAEFQINDHAEVVLGYKFMDFDWDKGSGRNRQAFDFQIHGPLIGMSFEF